MGPAQRYLVEPVRAVVGSAAEKVHSVDLGAAAADPLSPSSRDVHLVALRDEVLPLLKDQRLTTAEVLHAGQADRPKVFGPLDLELVWRVLNYAERHRYVTHQAATGDSPRQWVWDLTPEGHTQVSLFAILTKRAKYGGILGLAAAFAALFGADVKKVTAYLLAALIAFAAFMWLMVLTFRWLTPHAVEAIKRREAEVQDARERAGMAPWWPPLESAEP